MKKLLLILTAITLFSCGVTDSDDTTPTDITGTWEMIVFSGVNSNDNGDTISSYTITTDLQGELTLTDERKRGNILNNDTTYYSYWDTKDDSLYIWTGLLTVNDIGEYSSGDINSLFTYDNAFWKFHYSLSGDTLVVTFSSVATDENANLTGIVYNTDKYIKK